MLPQHRMNQHSQIEHFRPISVVIPPFFSIRGTGNVI
jgi:hypothetical protein